MCGIWVRAVAVSLSCAVLATAGVGCKEKPIVDESTGVYGFESLSKQANSGGTDSGIIQINDDNEEKVTQKTYSFGTEMEFVGPDESTAVSHFPDAEIPVDEVEPEEEVGEVSAELGQNTEDKWVDEGIESDIIGTEGNGEAVAESSVYRDVVAKGATDEELGKQYARTGTQNSLLIDKVVEGMAAAGYSPTYKFVFLDPEVQQKRFYELLGLLDAYEMGAEFAGEGNANFAKFGDQYTIKAADDSVCGVIALANPKLTVRQSSYGNKPVNPVLVFDLGYKAADKKGMLLDNGKLYAFAVPKTGITTEYVRGQRTDRLKLASVQNGEQFNGEIEYEFADINVGELEGVGKFTDNYLVCLVVVVNDQLLSYIVGF